MATIGKPTTVTAIDAAGNELAMTGHPFNTGDRVVVTSTGNVPGGLRAGLATSSSARLLMQSSYRLLMQGLLVTLKSIFNLRAPVQLQLR